MFRSIAAYRLILSCCSLGALSLSHAEPSDALKAGWKDLADFSMPAAAEQAVKQHGADWALTPLASGVGPLNQDYYTIRIQRLPNGWDEKQALAQYIAFLSDPNRPSSSRADGVQFLAENDSPIQVGKLFRLNFSPVDLSICRQKPECAGAWWLPEALCAELNVQYNNWCPAGGQKGWIVVTQRTGSVMRVTTVKAGQDVAADGAHPVAGTREFGIQKTATAYVLYTMAVDKSGFTTLPDTQPFTFLRYSIFGVGDQFWRSFNSEFIDYVKSKGGDAVVGRIEHVITPPPPSILPLP